MTVAAGPVRARRTRATWLVAQLLLGVGLARPSVPVVVAATAVYLRS